jgi:5-amino-6-(5-phosphoribosylamino)uracil reductase
VDTGRTVVISAAVSLDGCLDDASPRRLVLSGPEDLDEVDELRARCDAIVVGANTVRRDDPRLVVQSGARRAARVAAGRAATPLRVVLTRTGDIAADSAILTADERPPLVLVPGDGDIDTIRARLSGVAEVGAAGRTGNPDEVVAELARRDATRILVEGGADVITRFLAAGVVDEMRLAVAPVLVADPAAPRLVTPGASPWPPGCRARLVATRAVGDVAVMTYDLRGGDR